MPLAESIVEGELTTPTGAAILTTVVERFAPLPALTIESIGLGAGTRELPEQANIVRLFVGTVELPAASDRVWVLETNLDDLPGEVVGYTMTRLMEAGALDAFVTPIQMKKNRPGVMVSVLCDEAKIPALEDLLFRETATLGIRRYPVSRHKLKRQAIEVETPFGPVRGKLGWLGERPPTFSPEYDDCARIAAEQGIPLREVYDAAHAAYGDKPFLAKSDRRGSANLSVQGGTRSMAPETGIVLAVAAAFLLLGIAVSPLAWVAIWNHRSRSERLIERRFVELQGRVASFGRAHGRM